MSKYGLFPGHVGCTVDLSFSDLIRMPGALIRFGNRTSGEKEVWN
jgi:hypothetical protein